MLGKGQELLVAGDSILVLVPPSHPKRDEILDALKRGLMDGFERRSSERGPCAPPDMGSHSTPDRHPGTGEAGHGGEQPTDKIDLDGTRGGAHRVVPV